jgi:hypothetical protein
MIVEIAQVLEKVAEASMELAKHSLEGTGKTLTDISNSPEVQARLDNVVLTDIRPTTISCINSKLEGSVHPDTGVPFKRVTVEVDGDNMEIVIPEFNSKFDATIPEEMYLEPDDKQFSEVNQQLKEAIETDSDLRDQFSDEQLEEIRNGDTPSGYSWHHNEEPGKLQLVDMSIHSMTRHIGGRAIWGGGSTFR